MPTVDRERFMRDGYVILRDVLQPDEVMELRESYERLYPKQKAIWRDERGPDDPPGGRFETARQPRIQRIQNLIDAQTANTVEAWLSERTLGVAEQLLSQPVFGVHEMQVMCEPTFNYGPANWHRDISAEDCGPLRVLQEALLENGPDYVQWNLPLYDDKVLWVVPGSHARLNNEAENRQLQEDAQAPLPGGIPVELEAGDALAYTHYMLHWGSDYTPGTVRRTIHGGHTTYPDWPDIGFAPHLSPNSRARFESWTVLTAKLKDATERCLRAVMDKDRRAYLDGLQSILPGAGPAGQLQLTIYFCKAALKLHLLKRTDYQRLPVDVRGRAESTHGLTMNWGPAFAERFTKVEADAIWAGFSELERHLRGDGEIFVDREGKHSSEYYPEEMAEPFSIKDFVASWPNGSA